MSDPVTNVEIEDVLSSIRRLVSDGDKARTRDSAPQEAAVSPRPDAAPSPTPTGESPDAKRPDKLVLTPAFLVSDTTGSRSEGAEQAAPARPAPKEDVDAAAAPQDDMAPDGGHQDNMTQDDSPIDEGEDEGWQDEDWRETASADHSDATPVSDNGAGNAVDPDVHGDADEASDAPLTLTGMIWDRDEDRPQSTTAGDTRTRSERASADRAELVATIAELEAAIRPDVNDYEPDGNEPMSDTVAWPGSSARRFSLAEDAELSSDDGKTDDVPDAAEPDLTAFRHTHGDPAADGEVRAAAEPFEDEEAFATEAAQTPDSGQDDAEADDDYGDDDLDGLLEAGGAVLDEAALRALVAEVVREELTGPLGERITRNVRKLVRREIYRVLSSQDFD